MIAYSTCLIDHCADKVSFSKSRVNSRVVNVTPTVLYSIIEASQTVPEKKSVSTSRGIAG